MISTNVGPRLCTPKQVAQLGRAVAPLYQASVSGLAYPVGLRVHCATYRSHNGQSPRAFSTTNAAHLKDFFLAKETALIRKTPPAWPHHGWTEEEMSSIVAQHREAKTLGDKFAWRLVRTCRYVAWVLRCLLYKCRPANRVSSDGAWT